MISDSPPAPANRFPSNAPAGSETVQRFLEVAEQQLPHVGGRQAELAVLAWLRGMVPLPAHGLDQYRFIGPCAAAKQPAELCHHWARDRSWVRDRGEDAGGGDATLPPERDGQ